MDFQTADLCDANEGHIKVADPIFNDYGGKKAFFGQIVTLKVHEDNVLVKETLQEKGQGKVLIVDGGGSLRCALVGDNLAQAAIDNDWAGVIVYGCIRDSFLIGQMNLGVKALHTHPLKSVKRGRGDKNLPVNFAGVTFFPEHYVYADHDGVIVAERALV